MRKTLKEKSQEVKIKNRNITLETRLAANSRLLTREGLETIGAITKVPHDISLVHAKRDQARSAFSRDAAPGTISYGDDQFYIKAPGDILYINPLDIDPENMHETLDETAFLGGFGNLLTDKISSDKTIPIWMYDAYGNKIEKPGNLDGFDALRELGWIPLTSRFNMNCYYYFFEGPWIWKNDPNSLNSGVTYNGVLYYAQDTNPLIKLSRRAKSGDIAWIAEYYCNPEFNTNVYFYRYFEEPKNVRGNAETRWDQYNGHTSQLHGDWTHSRGNWIPWVTPKDLRGSFGQITWRGQGPLDDVPDATKPMPMELRMHNDYSHSTGFPYHDADERSDRNNIGMHGDLYYDEINERHQIRQDIDAVFDGEIMVRPPGARWRRVPKIFYNYDETNEEYTGANFENEKMLHGALPGDLMYHEYQDYFYGRYNDGWRELGGKPAIDVNELPEEPPRGIIFARIKNTDQVYVYTHAKNWVSITHTKDLI